MRKSIMTILAMTLVTIPAISQDEGEEIKIGVKKEKNNAFFIDPKIGATLTSMSDPEYDLYDASGTCIYASPLVGIPNTGLVINARYYFGLSELNETLSSKLYTLEVSVAWMFTAFKF